MSRISIDVTDSEHKTLKALAALQGKSIKEYVLERTLNNDKTDSAALEELEGLLNERLQAAQRGAISRRSVRAIFQEVVRKRAK